MKVLVLGASGMIGSAIFRTFCEKTTWDVLGTARSDRSRQFFQPSMARKLRTGIHTEDQDGLIRLFGEVQPDVVINCIGLTKHHAEANDPVLTIPVNALLPHRLAAMSRVAGARLIHISTDCVFSGKKGGYTEEDFADANDLYGRSKLLGEVHYPHAVTLRTSTIGHELDSQYGLLEWFLAQGKFCKGFNQAIFSGLPNVVFAEVIRDIVIPRPELSGLYHVGAQPIGKYELLRLIADTYQKDINIEKDESFAIDRSLNSLRFESATGYKAPDWNTLIKIMHTSNRQMPRHV